MFTILPLKPLEITIPTPTANTKTPNKTNDPVTDIYFARLQQMKNNREALKEKSKSYDEIILKATKKFRESNNALIPMPTQVPAKIVQPTPPANTEESFLMKGTKAVAGQVLNQQVAQLSQKGCNTMFYYFANALSSDPKYIESWINGNLASGCRMVAPIAVQVGLQMTIESIATSTTPTNAPSHPSMSVK